MSTREIALKGITWDHSRGYDPMVATSRLYAAQNPGVKIEWERHSLQAFADRSVSEMTYIFDLMVIDHPHAGEVARDGGDLVHKCLTGTLPPATCATALNDAYRRSHKEQTG